jgi:hypothetical protein
MYLKSHVPLEDVTISGKCELKDHVIVCGGITGLKYLIQTLRHEKLKKIHPILILHPNPPSDAQWDDVSNLPQVYFMQVEIIFLKS